MMQGMIANFSLCYTMICNDKMTAMNPELQLMLQKAMLAFQNGSFESAESMLQQALLADSKSAEFIFDLGIAYAEHHKLNEALSVFYCLQAFQKSDSRIPYNLGFIHSIKGDHEVALEAFKLALKLKPDDVDTLVNKGNTLHSLQRFDEALTHYERALSLQSNYAAAWSNKGVTLHELKRYDEAIAHYNQAISLQSDNAESWLNKGNILRDLKRFDEAIAHYDQALRLNPDLDWVYGDLLSTKMKICNWEGFSANLREITSQVADGRKVTNPFPLLYLIDDPFLHQQASKIYCDNQYPCNLALGFPPKVLGKRKLRIAYFSADFKNHAVAHLIAELFEIHDRNCFEVYAFSLVEASDDMSSRLKSAFDHFIDVQNLSDIEIAQLSRDFNIDIAIDLSGFTQGSRTGIFAYRAAPIQVNYLGYPGTMGTDYMDYIIADKTLIPPNFQHFYSEKIVYLPHSYQVNDRKRVIAARQFTRKELALPDQGFVFCCFNNSYKILPSTFESWMNILMGVEGSVLWLFQDNPWVSDHLKAEALKYGIDPTRLIFAKSMPMSEHLARHSQADLFLDTLPYNAHTTASDALWAGLPVLTIMGKSFASRVAASLLNAIGLPELIVDTQKEYEAMAIELALNPNKLADIKQKLSENRLSAPLFDTPLFTKNLELAYSKMYERYQNDLDPEHIVIS